MEALRDKMPGDVLIIGSGIGGLTAGIILSKLRFKVTIIEKEPLPGGLLRCYRRSGIDCPTGVHYIGGLDVGQPLRRLWDYLGVTALIPLERMGTGGIIDRYIFDDFVFDLPESLEAFEEKLRCCFPAEARQVSIIMDELRSTSQVLSRLDMVLSSSIMSISPDSLEPMGQRLREMGCSRRLTGLLSVPSTLIGVPLRDCPVFLYYMSLASYLLSSWRLADRGGMADAFLSRLSALGGNVIAGDGVNSIQVESGQAKGVVLKSGRILKADSLVAAIHPRTMVSLLPPESVRESYALRAETILNTKGLFGVNAAINSDSHEALPYNIYRLKLEDDNELHGTFHQVLKTGKPGMTLLSMITSSPIEEWRQWEGTVSGKRGSDYEAAKTEKARDLLEGAEKLLGPLGDIKMLDTYTPLTIRDWVGSPDGSPYGIIRSSGQMMKAASLNRAPVKGIFVSGQNRLSPGILGTVLGSFQTVRQMVGNEMFMREVAGELS
jgi:all-trans-retinol 13,14-reductase